MSKMNDGLYDCEGMIDQLIADLNSGMKYLFNGQSIAFCDSVRSIAQGMAVLKDGVRKELESRDKTISELREEINSVGKDMEG